jgi:hypothetical protein
MCRLFAISSKEPVSPMVAIDAMDVMREGHDGSGVGLFLRDLSGPFEDMKDAPILSGIFTEAGAPAPGRYHDGYRLSTKVQNIHQGAPRAPGGDSQTGHLSDSRLRIPRRVGGLDGGYDLGLVETRLKLRAMGERNRI